MALSDEYYADPIDQAARETERQTAEFLRIHKEKAKQKLPATGKCWFCQEAVKKGLLFCKPSKADIEDGYSCRDEYDRVKEAKIRNGR